jgi:hypothetical protein
MKKLKCATHGSSPWLFTIFCIGCGRVYQAVLEGTDFDPIVDGAVRAPEICACGSKLTGREGSARAICTSCFKDRVAAGSGPVA